MKILAKSFHGASKTVMIIVGLLLLLPASALAQDGLTPLFRFPSLQVQAGSELRLKVYFHNESDADFLGELPQSLALRFQDNGQKAVLVTAVEIESSPEQKIAPGEFIAKDYRLEIPNHYLGAVEVALAESPETAVLLSVKTSLPQPEQDAAVEVADTNQEDQKKQEGQEKQDHYPSLESLHSLYQPYVVNLSAYEPMFFLVGSDPEKSKFQISFKYRLFNPAGSLSQTFPWLRGLHFAYTQTSFWDLSSESAPFLDTSYKPGLFLLSSNWKNRPDWLQGFFVQAGVQHESNGRGEEFSRSTNMAYIEPIFVFFDPQTVLGLQLRPRFMMYIDNDDDTNPDLADYRGHAELEVKFGKASGLVSKTLLGFAEKGVSVQTDLTYPISKLLKSNFDIFFHLQYTNALAESLINYQKRSESLRLGVSFVR
ncbi:hypothetical protein A7E78_11050 [Syntrophotalea acetylenivorans]|uniref:Phosphatidylcholine 1-acylhydrolase n=1 Tax=Syntrophotalea acetylenivorans TaxID=1842532 RepID=A0A1L3GQW7_9BACT|nr:phospholipase A [Syntrophotalea acetylenivorans]APG28339.1 hypothetical protein A7E78_11050 [Syntrophotalea acetylenivorans]